VEHGAVINWFSGGRRKNDPGPKQTMKMSQDEFRRMCDAVDGYTALGLVDEALNILEDLPPNLKITREVITLHMGILLKSKDYLKASYLAETLSMSEPENMDRMLDVARYRYKAGEFKDALTWLVSVEKKCLNEADFHYMSAQCHAAFGDLEQARRSLQKVSVLSETLRMRALDDPVFEAIYGAEPILE
jgi:predicted Zn-dependent protease